MANIKKTVKKPVVKSKSKVVAGGKKARFSKPVLVLIVLSSLLVLTAVGTFGYSKWKENDVKARAGGAARIYNSGGWEFWVCQTSYPPASGAQVRVYAYKPVGLLTPELLAVSTRDQAAQSIFSAAVTRQWRGNNTVATTEVAVPYNGWYRVATRQNDKILHQSPMVSINFTPRC